MDNGKRKQRFDEWRLAYYSTDDWKWVCEGVIRRDKCCQKCKEPYRRSGEFEVHHKHYLYFGQGDLLEIESCILLCRSCHSRIHRRDIDYDKLDKIFDESERLQELEKENHGQ